MRKDYKITVKVRNNNLLRAIADMGLEPGQKLAEMIGINYSTLNDYINLTKSPTNQKTAGIYESALKICDFLNKLPDDLWSCEQSGKLDQKLGSVDNSLGWSRTR